MSFQSVYIIDSSSLIDLRRSYPIDIIPGIWDALTELVRDNRLIAPEEVRKEIQQGRDSDLNLWLRENKRIFKKLDSEQIQTVKELLVKFPQVGGVNKESAHADPFLIALALVCKKRQSGQLFHADYIVVTGESNKPFRVPYVCSSYDVTCISLLELARREKWKFKSRT